MTASINVQGVILYIPLQKRVFVFCFCLTTTRRTITKLKIDQSSKDADHHSHSYTRCYKLGRLCLLRKCRCALHSPIERAPRENSTSWFQSRRPHRCISHDESSHLGLCLCAFPCAYIPRRLRSEQELLSGRPLLEHSPQYVLNSPHPFLFNQC